MPRDAQGNYTLPSGNPVVTGTVITSTWANPTMADIGNELSNSLSRDGQGGMRVPFENFDGTENAPGITFNNEPTLGFYRPGNGIVGVSGQGDTIALFKAGVGNIEVVGAAPLVAADLTRKDYVDEAIATALATALAELQESDWPVGSRFIGPDPNGSKPGTWGQLPEGTFLMNTIGGVDPSGGSNDAVHIAHGHGITDPGHGHAITDPGHNHTMNNNYVGSDAEGGNGDDVSTPNSAVTGSRATGISVNQGVTNVSVIDSGVPGTDLNKPLYVGVEVWERTA
jgi:hypothetical protein